MVIWLVILGRPSWTGIGISGLGNGLSRPGREVVSWKVGLCMGNQRSFGLSSQSAWPGGVWGLGGLGSTEPGVWVCVGLVPKLMVLVTCWVFDQVCRIGTRPSVLY